MTLTEMSIAGGILILATLILRWFTKSRIPKITFVVLWCIAVLRLLVPYSLESSLSLYNITPDVEQMYSDEVTGSDASVQPDTPQIDFPDDIEGKDDPIGDWGGEVEVHPATPFVPGTVTPAPDDVPADEFFEQITVPEDNDKPLTAGRLLKTVWLAGAVACAVYFCIAYIKLRKELAASLPESNELVLGFAKNHKLIRRVKIRTSDRIQTPMTYGLIRPVIVMPKIARGCSEKQLEYIIEHEYVHIRRMDVLLKAALIAAVCIHWFNPMVWVMLVLCNRDLELSCDEAVIRKFGRDSRAEYANTLIGFEEMRGGLPSLMSGFSKNAIEERIKSMMKIRKLSIIAVAAAVMIVATVFVVFATSSKNAEDVPEGGETEETDIEPDETEATVTDPPVTEPPVTEQPVTEGIDYDISEDGTYAMVIGYGGTSDKVRIANEYNGLPVTTINNRAFSSTKITSVIIPESVTTIGECAFLDCSDLTNVIIPDSVTTIVEGAFYGCSNLKDLTIPDSVANIGEYAFWGLDDSLYSEYGNCVYLKNGDNPYYLLIKVLNSDFSTYTIHSDTKVIAEYVFKDCYRLSSIEIPDSVTSIGKSAFYRCSDLTNVTIGNSVTTISEYAFYFCFDLTSVTIPDSVTTIGEYAFYYCSNLTSVTIPDNVVSIGKSAFGHCSSLTSITIPDGVVSIGDRMFSGCSSLTSVTIPYSVTTIGEYAFMSCSNLTIVTIPDSVISIGECAFYGCSNLTNVTIGNSVVSIGHTAFADCNSLTNINYRGTQSEWEAISKEYYWMNDYILNSITITYNYAGE